MIVILARTFRLRHCVNKLLVTGNKKCGAAELIITVTLNIRLNETCFPSCILHSILCFRVRHDTHLIMVLFKLLSAEDDRSSG